MVDARRRVAVVTGTSSGLGKATVAGLLAAGFRVVATVRDEARGAAALHEWRAAVPGAAVELVRCELASLRSVEEAASAIARRVDRVDVLVNNAGGIQGERRLGEDGVEATLAGNHLGPFALTRSLLPLLQGAGRGRVINVASEAHRLVRKVPWHDLQSETGYRPMKAYALSKLANLLFTRELSRRFDPDRITANAVHPGVVRTRFGESGTRLFRVGIKLVRSLFLDEVAGADTSVWLATAAAVDGLSGGYYAKRRRVRPSRVAESDDSAERLWEVSERLAGPWRDVSRPRAAKEADEEGARVTA